MPTQPLGPIKILYIEDDPNSRRLVQRVLEAEGYHVATAEDGLSGLELARKLRPALILTDIGIGELSGQEVATKLKAQAETHNTPVIALTAATLASDRERALATGCDGYITKPIDVDTLPRLVKQFLAGAKERVADDVKMQRLEEYSHALVSRLETTVAELQQANIELRRLDRMKRDFIILASHELRTPTTLIYGYINLLKMEMQSMQPGEHVTDMIGRISTATQRLNEVVDAIINVSLIDAEQLEVNAKPIVLHTLLQSIVQELQPGARQRAQTLRVGDMADLPPLPGDVNYLRRAFTNLIDNAIKYTPDSGHIAIDAHQEHEAIHITISDTGIGIDRTEQERIFDKFYVLENTAFHSTSRNAFLGGGLGLGLTVAHGLIEAHGGRIWVESEGQDTTRLPGSRFHILLPLNSPKSPKTDGNTAPHG